MTGPSTKTQSQLISDQVDLMAGSLLRGNRLDEIAWQKLYREVLRLEELPKFKRDSFLYQAFLYSFKRDADKVQQILNKYAASFGKDYSWYQNRAMLGVALGRSDMVTDLVDHGYAEDDIEELFSVFELTSQIGLMKSAATVLEKLRKLNVPAERVSSIPLASEVLKAAAYFEFHDIDEREVAKRVARASAVVGAANGFVAQYALRVLSDGVLYEFGVYGDAGKVVNVEWEITESLISEFGDDLSEHVSIGALAMSVQ